jgi:flagellar protein FlaF
MGFSVSAATAIIFTGIVLLAGVMSSVVFEVYGDLKDAALDASSSEFARQRTRIEVLDSSYDATRVFINVTNTGETSLSGAQVDVLLNGTIYTESIKTKKVSDMTTDVWGIHEVMYLEVNYKKANDRVRIVVVTPNGVSGSKLMK